MKTQLREMVVEVLFTCTEREAVVLNHVASYVRSKDWKEHFSKNFGDGVSEEQFDGVMLHLHQETGRVLSALRSGRARISDELRGVKKENET